MYLSEGHSSGEILRSQAWALYRLQSLPAAKLILVVNRILRGDDILLNPLCREIPEEELTQAHP